MIKRATTYGNKGALIGAGIPAVFGAIDFFSTSDKEEKKKALKKTMLKSVLGAGVGYGAGQVYGGIAHPFETGKQIAVKKYDKFKKNWGIK